MPEAETTTSPSPASPSTIGGLNGRWKLLFKLALATYPLLIAWAGFITSETVINRYFRQQGDRVTPTDVHSLEMRLEARIAGLPPRDWRTRIESLETKVDEANVGLVRTQVQLENVLEKLERLSP